LRIGRTSHSFSSNSKRAGEWVYANGDKSKDKFDQKLHFRMTLPSYKGDSSWVEEKIIKLKECLDGDTIPEGETECDYCKYRESVTIAIKWGRGNPSWTVNS